MKKNAPYCNSAYTKRPTAHLRFSIPFKETAYTFLFLLLTLVGSFTATAQKRLLFATTGSLSGNMVKDYAVTQGWTSTACSLGSDNVALGPISGQTMPCGAVLTKANFDVVIFGTIYNTTIDATYITALINFMNEGGRVYFLVDGANPPYRYYAPQLNQLMTAATGISSSMAEGIDDVNRANINESPNNNIGGVQGGAVSCTNNLSNYPTGSYITSTSIPDNVLYYTYGYNTSPYYGKANLLFTKTVAGGVLGIATEYFSGGSAGGSYSPSAAMVQAIYKNVFGSQLSNTGNCQAASASLTKSVAPSSILSGGTAVYTFKITNTAADALAQSGIQFTDNLPSGLQIAASPGISLTGGTGGTVTAVAGGTSVALSGLSLAVGQTATITLNVTNVAGQLNPTCSSTPPAAFTNRAANISGLSSNLSNDVTNVCLIITTPPCAATAGSLQ